MEKKLEQIRFSSCPDCFVFVTIHHSPFSGDFFHLLFYFSSPCKKLVFLVQHFTTSRRSLNGTRVGSPWSWSIKIGIIAMETSGNRRPTTFITKRRCKEISAVRKIGEKFEKYFSGTCVVDHNSTRLKNVSWRCLRCVGKFCSAISPNPKLFWDFPLGDCTGSPTRGDNYLL